MLIIATNIQQQTSDDGRGTSKAPLTPEHLVRRGPSAVRQGWEGSGAWEGCWLRDKANKTVCYKVITAIDGELMQEGKQILSQDRYSEHFITAQTLQLLSLCAFWSQAVTKRLPPLAAVVKNKRMNKNLYVVRRNFAVMDHYHPRWPAASSGQISPSAPVRGKRRSRGRRGRRG